MTPVVHVNCGALSEGRPEGSEGSEGTEAPEALEALLERAVRLTLERARPPSSEDASGTWEGGAGRRAAALPEISLTLLDDVGMADLNERYLGRSGTTDVLAFSLGEPGAAPLGDVYVGHEQAARQAHDHAVSLAEELARLAIHGTLHVLGHDHPEGPERLDSPMFELQERVLGELLEPMR